MFSLSCYTYLNYYKKYCHNFPEALEGIKSIEITADAFVDLSVLFEMLGDCLVLSFTANGLTYWQQLCEIKFAHGDAAEYKINTNNFTSLYAICNEIEQILLEQLCTTYNVILSIFDLKTK